MTALGFWPHHRHPDVLFDRYFTGMTEENILINFISQSQFFHSRPHSDEEPPVPNALALSVGAHLIHARRMLALLLLLVSILILGCNGYDSDNGVTGNFNSNSNSNGNGNSNNNGDPY